MKNLRSTLATVWRIAAPYFRSEDRFAGWALLAAVIVIELSLVGIDVLLNQWRNRFYNALQERNWEVFVNEIGVFTILAAGDVVLVVYQLYLNQWLQIRWRRWMTSNYLGEWLHGANHYRMQLQGDAAGVFCHHFVESVGGSSAAHLRPCVRYPRLSGVGRADLCGVWNGAGAVDRLAAGQP